jgi:hypothetical protein
MLYACQDWDPISDLQEQLPTSTGRGLDFAREPCLEIPIDGGISKKFVENNCHKQMENTEISKSAKASHSTARLRQDMSG